MKILKEDMPAKLKKDAADLFLLMAVSAGIFGLTVIAVLIYGWVGWR